MVILLFISNSLCSVIMAFALQIIFHKENPGIDYEFYVPVEKKDADRERPVEREWETPRHPPRERSRERDSGRAPLRSKSIKI